MSDFVTSQRNLFAEYDLSDRKGQNNKTAAIVAYIFNAEICRSQL